MKNYRIACLLLLLLGALLHLSYIVEVFGSESFFAGMACYALGLVIVLVGRLQAPALASPRPVLSEPEPEPLPPLPMPRTVADEPVRSRADQVVEMDPGPALHSGAELGEIELTDVDDPNAVESDGFSVTSDISLPVEIQSELSLSDQLDKLKRLHESGDLTEEEFQRAKAKLLS